MNGVSSLAILPVLFASSRWIKMRPSTSCSCQHAFPTSNRHVTAAFRRVPVFRHTLGPRIPSAGGLGVGDNPSFGSFVSRISIH